MPPEYTEPAGSAPTTWIVGVLLLEEATDAADRAAGAHPGDEVGDPPLGLLPDLRTGVLVVRARVVRVAVLVGLPGALGLAHQPVRDAVVAVGVVGRHGRRADDHLGAVRLEHVALVLADLVGADEDALVAALLGDQGQADPGVAGGRLDDRAAGLQLAAGLGRVHHADGDPVLHRAAGVEVLDLREHQRRRSRRPCWTGARAGCRPIRSSTEFAYVMRPTYRPPNAENGRSGRVAECKRDTPSSAHQFSLQPHVTQKLVHTSRESHYTTGIALARETRRMIVTSSKPVVRAALGVLVLGVALSPTFVSAPSQAKAQEVRAAAVPRADRAEHLLPPRRPASASRTGRPTAAATAAPTSARRAAARSAPSHPGTAQVATNPAWGGKVVVRVVSNRNGLVTSYGFLWRAAVQQGQIVQSGQALGTVGGQPRTGKLRAVLLGRRQRPLRQPDALAQGLRRQARPGALPVRQHRLHRRLVQHARRQPHPELPLRRLHLAHAPGPGPAEGARGRRGRAPGVRAAAGRPDAARHHVQVGTSAPSRAASPTPATRSSGATPRCS